MKSLRGWWASIQAKPGLAASGAGPYSRVWKMSAMVAIKVSPHHYWHEGRTQRISGPLSREACFETCANLSCRILMRFNLFAQPLTFRLLPLQKGLDLILVSQIIDND